ncbi:MAG: amidase [Halopseudomonas sp.]|uniref:amidase n=1 Tax=Halopseudomonas sp. TaxID=2901191 RepID=UPI003002FBFB
MMVSRNLLDWPGMPHWDSQTILEGCLAEIARPDAQGDLVFRKVHAAAARSEAMCAGSVSRSRPLAGLPVSVKDLFDVTGDVTCAGSRVLTDAKPANQDAVAVARLRRAGAIIVGRTAMTEFAYSGLGLNPHYGTPGNFYDRSRIPGGSSAGAGIAVRAGMCLASLATDTNGSIRIPAAFSGTVGFRPTGYRIPRQGLVPLSPTQDSVGPIARTVAQCAAIDSVLSGQMDDYPQHRAPEGLVLGVPSGFLQDDLDSSVSEAFASCLSKLSIAGASIRTTEIHSLELAKQIGPGGITGPEALRWHRAILSDRGHMYDPRVLARLNGAHMVDDVTLNSRLEARLAAIRQFSAEASRFDAILCPTVAIIPPYFREVQDDDSFFRLNALVLRNTSAFSVVDAPSITLPMQLVDALPVGIMVSSVVGRDRRLLSVAATIERIIASNE